jgi:hypothetical protein
MALELACERRVHRTFDRELAVARNAHSECAGPHRERHRRRSAQLAIDVHFLHRLRIDLDLGGGQVKNGRVLEVIAGRNLSRDARKSSNLVHWLCSSDWKPSGAALPDGAMT